MRVPIFHVDAFTSVRFKGNPAAVIPLERYPDDATLQAIAAENNLSETAFLEPAGAAWNLRWFTPTVEVPLCGHATLASAWVVFERLARERAEVSFLTRRSGELRVRRGERGGLQMDFPSRPLRRLEPGPDLTSALGATPLEILANDDNYAAVLPSASAVRGLTPDIGAIGRLDRPGLIVTAAGDAGYDCVSRYFAPQKGIAEDPVTGGAHCALTPYWSAKLGKKELVAFQASARGGVLRCRAMGDRVALAGECVLYSEGHAEVD